MHCWVRNQITKLINKNFSKEQKYSYTTLENFYQLSSLSTTKYIFILSLMRKVSIRKVQYMQRLPRIVHIIWLHLNFLLMSFNNKEKDWNQFHSDGVMINYQTKKNAFVFLIFNFVKITLSRCVTLNWKKKLILFNSLYGPVYITH